MSVRAVESFNYTGVLNPTNWSPEFGSAGVIATSHYTGPLSGVAQVAATNQSIPGSGLYTGYPNWLNDQWAQVTLNACITSSSNYIGLCLRDTISSVVANKNAYRVYVLGPLGNATTVNIGVIVQGVFQLLVSSPAMSIPVGSVLYGGVQGTTVSALINGTPIISVVDTNVASGIPGFVIQSTLAVTDSQASAFSAGDYTVIPPSPTSYSLESSEYF